MGQLASSLEAVRHDRRSAAGEDDHTATSIAAGDDDRIPRLFLGSADLAVLVIAFLAAHALAPSMQRALLPGGLLYPALPGIFPIPAAPTSDFPPLDEVIWLLVATAPASLVVMELAGGYRRLLGQSATRLTLNAMLSQVIAMSFGAFIGTALRLSSASRVVIFSYGLLSIVGLVTYRATIWTYQRRRQRRGVYAKNVLIVAQPRSVEWMVRHFQRNVEDTQFRLVGWLGVTVDQPHTPERRRDDAARDIPLERLGRVEDLGALLVHHPVHEIIAIQSSVDRDWLRQVIDQCDYFRIRLRIVPEALLVRKVGDLQLAFRDDPLRLPEVVLSPRYLDEDALFVKRLLDIVVSAVSLILLAPVFLIIAIAIKLTTPNLPVFYPWRVIGLNGRPFTGYKFTTMVADADQQKASLMSQNEMQGPVFKIKSDPRVTPLGRFLRKYSLNELPQIWSVLKGDMSLVGPRPAFRHELERYELWHKRKLTFKPGITCLWQVSGRNRISDFDEWVRLDLEYIDRWSLALDIRILARTFWAVVSGSGS
jgi:exopolysaccharide biosynthesis polyprenyl glycosylphosphotransferase